MNRILYAIDGRLMAAQDITGVACRKVITDGQSLFPVYDLNLNWIYKDAGKEYVRYGQELLSKEFPSNQKNRCSEEICVYIRVMYNHESDN